MAGIILAPLIGWTQSAEVHFTYDACGNRILKSLQLKKTEENGKFVEDGNAFLDAAIDYIQETEVGLYPNPTNGKFTVTLSGNTCLTLEATLTTETGVVIEHHRFSDSQHEFDLSAQPSGIYILKLILDNETRTWKIVKH
jgi:hypothetical protein